MHTATYRTVVHTSDWATVEFTARSAADDLTIVDRVHTTRLKDMTEVAVDFQALNANEANATARTVRNALSHVAPTDEGRVMI